MTCRGVGELGGREASWALRRCAADGCDRVRRHGAARALSGAAPSVACMRSCEAPTTAQAAARMERTLRCLFGPGHPYSERVVAVPGDVTRPALGLRGRLDALAERVSEVVHGAATVSFSSRARGGARDQRRGHPAHARIRRALSGAGRPAALLSHLHRIRGRRACGLLLRGRPRRRPALSQRL